MKLDFPILWFDDQPENLESAGEGIRQRLGRVGFELSVSWVRKFDQLGKLKEDLRSRGDQFDLVLMDWNLGGDTDGAEMAKHVRQALRFTDIIFYSSEPAKKLRKLVAKKNIDGVYCAHRNVLVDHTMEVATRLIRRVLNLDHMRGLFVAGVADMDHMVVDCLLALSARLPEEAQAQLIQDAVGRLEESAESNSTDVQELANGSMKDIVASTRFGSDLRVRTLRSGLESLNAEIDLTRFIGKLETYQDDVLIPRNVLAHQKAKLKRGSLRFERGYVLSPTSVNKLRMLLQDHRLNLGDLLERLRRDED